LGEEVFHSSSLREVEVEEEVVVVVGKKVQGAPSLVVGRMEVEVVDED